MNMTEVLKEEMNKSFKESQEKKQTIERSKTVQDLKMEIEAIKKTEGILEKI